MKEFKSVRNKICSRIENIDKMRKKLKGNKQTEVMTDFPFKSCSVVKDNLVWIILWIEVIVWQNNWTELSNIVNWNHLKPN